MATYEYDDFDVTFTTQPDGSYAVTAACPDGSSISRAFDIPITETELEHTILQMARSRSRKVSPPPPLQPPAATTREVGPAVVSSASQRDEQAELLGTTLADALFGGDIGTAYDTARRASVAERRGLRLTLTLGDAPELLNLPWEFLYRPPRFLASQRHTPLVRRLRAVADDSAPEITSKVRILGVVASPRNLRPLDTAQERRRVEEAVRPMVERGRVELDWLEPATPRRLREALRDDRYHVLHYVGHSAFTGHDEGALYLEDEYGGAAPVDNTMLANLLSDQTGLRLVVLNSCEGARTTVRDPYAGIATTLIQLGVPAVVAMQFEITDRAAILFAEELYTNLIGRQDPIDAAVAEARKAIYIEIDRVEWATPVLFVRDPDVRLFRFKVEREPLPPPPPPELDEPIAPVESDSVESDSAESDSAESDSAESDSAESDPVESDPVEPERPSPDDLTATEASGTPPSGTPPVGTPPVGTPPVGTPPVEPGTSTRRFGWVWKALGIGMGLLVAIGIVGALADSGDPPVSPPDTTVPGVPQTGVTTNQNGTTDQNGTGDQAGTTVPVDTVLAPRPEFGNLAIQLLRDTGDVHLKSYDEETGVEGNLTDKPGAADFDADWQPGTSRIAFVRYRPEDGEGFRINYAADGDKPNGIEGKFVRPLIPWEPGIYDHAPAWSPSGDLYYAESIDCIPSVGCGESVWRAGFEESEDADGFLDELSLVDEVEVLAGFVDITAISAHPRDENRLAIADASGVWFADAATGNVSLVAPEAYPLSMEFTGDGRFLVAIGAFEGGASWGLVDNGTGAVATAFVAEERRLQPSWVSITAEGERGILALSEFELAGEGTVLARLEVGDDGSITYRGTVPDDRLPDGVPVAIDR